MVASSRHREMAFDYLVAKVNPTSVSSLSVILAELTKAGLLRRIIRVESPTMRGGIKDFSSLEEVPPTISDWRGDEQEIEVTPDRLRVYYSVH